ncbi:hypothetical protein HKX48_003912 [Thoreauomyces humboldtii]|nr:hypothetical protein HKX48_003912 [Thoreauomyces humboldtii]
MQEHGTRIDEFPERRLGMRKNVARLKVLNGEVSVKGSAHARFVDLKPAGLLNAGDVVVAIMIKRKPKENQMTKAERTELDTQIDEETKKLRASILYRDEQILVINKYQGLAVQGGSKTSMHLDRLLEGLKFDAEEASRLVHRLDKDTTGAMLLARSKRGAARISKMLKSAEDSIEKSYMAVVIQSPSAALESRPVDQAGFRNITTGVVLVGKPGVEKMTTVEWYDGDVTDPGDGVKKAVTLWKPITAAKPLSLLELRPQTGRKHQLRVHCALELKTPILGDYKYGQGCPKGLRGYLDGSRVPMHLHMRKLTVRDWYGPGSDLVVTAPIPPHMEKTLHQLDIIKAPSSVS